MVETIVVVALLAVTLTAALILGSYRRFGAARKRLVAHIRRRAPEITIRHPTDVGFVADVLGAEVAVDVASLLGSKRAGGSEEAWFDQIIDGLRARVPEPKPAPFALVIDRVLPLLKPMAYVEIFEQYRPALRLAWSPFAHEIAVTYVITATDRRTTITAGMVTAWSTTVQALHTLAVDNLRKQTRHILAEIDGARAQYEHLDGFDATRILVADLILPGGIIDPMIAIPEESVLLIAPASAQDELAVEAAARHASSARPVSPRLFRPAVGSLEGQPPQGSERPDASHQY